MFNDFGRAYGRLSRTDVEFARFINMWPCGHMQSLVQAYFEGNKSLVVLVDCSGGDEVPFRLRQFEPCLFRFQSRACKLEVGHALLQFGTCRAVLAGAVVVRLMDYGQGGEGLEAEYEPDSQDGQKPSDALAYKA